MNSDPGIVAATLCGSFAGISFVPIAARFELFPLLVEAGHGTPAELLKRHQQNWEKSGKGASPLNIVLLQDVLFIMAGIRLVSRGNGDDYRPNHMTQHLVDHPSALCGLLTSIEGIMAAAFLVPQLEATNFQYPFKENQTPLQYAYQSMGKTEMAKMDIYDIRAAEGRTQNFNTFMDGKFGIKGEPSFPDLVKTWGYDLVTKLSGGTSEYAFIDIGGGRGHKLQEILTAYPDVQPKSLVLQDVDVSDISSEIKEKFTVMKWNFKESLQPVEGASVYFTSWIFHNLPDEAAENLLRKIASAMREHSRLLIVEPMKNLMSADIHAIMILIMGGRERNSAEWKALAKRCGLEVSFEVYPPYGDGMVEMRRIFVPNGSLMRS